MSAGAMSAGTMSVGAMGVGAMGNGTMKVVRAGRIAATLAALRERQEKALITYVMAGDPNLGASLKILLALERAGADILEVGLPFSDPLADGPVIQAAGQRALRGGVTPDQVFGLVADFRKNGGRAPVALMTYYNILHARGLARFCADANGAGVDGLIIPDLPVGEGRELLEAVGRVGADGWAGAPGTAEVAAASGLDCIQFIAPTSTSDRIRASAQAASGFLYVVSLTGVTGARSSLSGRFKDTVLAARRYTDLPVAVGFGVGSPDQVREVAEVADGVIVGSAIVRLCALDLPEDEMVERVKDFVAKLKEATRG